MSLNEKLNCVSCTAGLQESWLDVKRCPPTANSGYQWVEVCLNRVPVVLTLKPLSVLLKANVPEEDCLYAISKEKNVRLSARS